MFVDFNELGESSKIWIYQADRLLTSSEEGKIVGALTKFCNQWAAHGQPLRTSFKIEHHYFIILGVDENYSNASGCSIDGSVHILKSLEQEVNIKLFDRSKIAFFLNQEVKTFSKAEMKKLLHAGQLDAKSSFFNNVITVKQELATKWLIKVGDSWLSKYLPDTVVAS